MEEKQLIPNLFRTEFSKIVSVLCKTFGIANLHLAEDITSETFLVATETWSLKGVPQNPKAWLYAVAKNKAKDYFKRKSLFTDKIVPTLSNADHLDYIIDLSEENIEDSQLRLLFTVCNPILSTESQISLALRVLCGFGIQEIASALLTSKSTINKRLQRAKTNYKKHNIQLELPEANELKKRQENVLTVIYLLFNEGYYSFTTEKNIRKDLCLEAMRLLYLFLNHHNTPEANALMALCCFHASRFDAREDELGNPILYENQDKSKWSQALISKGESYLHESAFGNKVSKYHLEASIAFWHTKPEESQAKWEGILQLYNHLLQIEYSPITALNRTYALSKANSKEEAIVEALKIDLKNNHLYHSLLAELYQNIDNQKEIEHLKTALTLVKTNSEKEVIELKLKKASNRT
jgi:RNA polymerase sigma-70 factor (ECF subfamily)